MSQLLEMWHHDPARHLMGWRCSHCDRLAPVAHAKNLLCARRGPLYSLGVDPVDGEMTSWALCECGSHLFCDVPPDQPLVIAAAS